MAKMVKCDQGHYFDQSKNTRCPFCGVSSISISPTMKYDRTLSDDTTAMYEQGRGANDANDGNTIAYDLTKRPGGSASDDPEATKAIWTQKIGIDPVVGWLVCVEGSNRGRDYRIRSGWNAIGRDHSMQICIAGDDTISRADHAKLFFDPKTKAFHIVSGGGRSGVYVNGSAVLQPTQLQPYDRVEIGNSILLFVPFCNPEFSWEPKANS